MKIIDKMTVKTKPVCPDCGSDDVLLDAWITWDVIGQRFEVSADFENGFCESCHEDFKRAIWIDADLAPPKTVDSPACRQPSLS